MAAQQSAELIFEATYAEGLGHVERIRELPNGRVMVADPIGQALLLLAQDLSSADTLGRVGSGPQEYQQPDAVFPLPGDSTLLIDLGALRNHNHSEAYDINERGQIVGWSQRAGEPPHAVVLIVK